MAEVLDKRYFSIGEVARLSHVPHHTLRYWETVFPNLRPIKRNQHRYYQKQEVLLVLRIRELIRVQGFTTRGALLQLKNPTVPEGSESMSGGLDNKLKVANCRIT